MSELIDTANGSVFCTKEYVETLENDIVEKDAEIADLRRQLQLKVVLDQLKVIHDRVLA